MEPRTLKTLRVSEKLELLTEIDKGETEKGGIAKKYGIPPSTLSTILNNRDRLHTYIVNKLS